VREARDLYADTAHSAVVRALAERLDAPLRVAVSNGGGGESSALVAALAALEPDGAPTPAGVALVDPAPDAAAFVMLLRRDADDVLVPDVPAGHRPAHGIGALLVEGPVDESADQAAADCASRPDVRRRCHVVVPVAPALARAGVRLSDEQHRALQARAEDDAGPPPSDEEAVVGAMAGNGHATAAGAHGGGWRAVPARGGAAVRTPAPAKVLPLPFEPAVVRFAVATIRSGRAPTRQALATALVQGSGLPRLRELVTERLARRADALKARSVLLALEDLVRGDPPPEGDGSLRYRLDRIRSGAHELTEIDVVDALQAGELDLPESERRAAELLLGAAGTDPRSRLGLPQGAGKQEVRQAAAEQLGRWRGRAANPLAGVDVRKAADVLAQACERLLAGAA
jgi:hypothetical protein